MALLSIPNNINNIMATIISVMPIPIISIPIISILIIAIVSIL